jgi:hypothetical protein
MIPIHDTAGGKSPRRKNAVPSDVGNAISLSPNRTSRGGTSVR